MAATDEEFIRDFLAEDYKLKVQYLTDHLTRMWTRFSIFVTLQSGLVAVLLIEGQLSDAAPYIALVELALSLLWFAMGRHDRHLVRIYKHQIKQAAVELQAYGLPEDHCVVSEVPNTNVQVSKQVTGLGGRLLEGTTAKDIPMLPALIPALLVVLWVGLYALLQF